MDALNAKMDNLTKLVKGKSRETSKGEEAFKITCDFCGEHTHLSSYCASINPEHITAFNSKEPYPQGGNRNNYRTQNQNQGQYNNYNN